MKLNPTDFWQFSLSHYAQANVPSHLLNLQDHWKGNVNIVLLCHWLDHQSLALSNADWIALFHKKDETDPVIQAHRQYRKQNKQNLTTKQYNTLLKQELHQEKAQQAQFIAVLPLLQQQKKTHNVWQYLKYLANVASASLETSFMQIPWQTLDSETLNNLIEHFVLREGTDYGEEERTLEEKVAQVREQLKQGEAVLFFSELHETVDIKRRSDLKIVDQA
jgi:hypothetical protein